MNFRNNLNTYPFTIAPNRFEVIDHREGGSGRDFTRYNCHVSLSASDDGTCLFIHLEDARFGNLLRYDFDIQKSVTPDAVIVHDYNIVQSFYDEVDVKIEAQDEGRTLKLFLYDR